MDQWDIWNKSPDVSSEIPGHTKQTFYTVQTETRWSQVNKASLMAFVAATQLDTSDILIIGKNNSNFDAQTKNCFSAANTEVRPLPVLLLNETSMHFLFLVSRKNHNTFQQKRINTITANYVNRSITHLKQKPWRLFWNSWAH